MRGPIIVCLQAGNVNTGSCDPFRPAIQAAMTERELEVFRLIARGLSNAEIGPELYISDTTVKTHIMHILMKLSLRDRCPGGRARIRDGALRLPLNDHIGSVDISARKLGDHPPRRRGRARLRWD